MVVVCRGEVNYRRLTQGYSSKPGSVSHPLKVALVCRGEVNSRWLSQGYSSKPCSVSPPLQIPCASVRENTRAWVPWFLYPYWMDLFFRSANTAVSSGSGVLLYWISKLTSLIIYFFPFSGDSSLLNHYGVLEAEPSGRALRTSKRFPTSCTGLQLSIPKLRPFAVRLDPLLFAPPLSMWQSSRPTRGDSAKSKTLAGSYSASLPLVNSHLNHRH